MCREQYRALSQKIKNASPFLNIMPHDFAANIADDVIRRSEREALDRELRVVAAQREREVQKVDDIERLLGTKKQWQQNDVEY